MTLHDKIAIFKYGLIAPVIHDNSINQKKYFKQLAEKEYELPGKPGKTCFKWRTFKKWLHLFRTAGYEALKPAVRKDKGRSRKIEIPVQDRIKTLCSEYEFKTISNLYRYLLSEEVISPSAFTEVTLRNFMRDHQITLDPAVKKPRKAFEAPNINILWTADFMHGPYVREGKRKIKSYLCAIIDDYSRLIPGSGFFPYESSLALEKTLKDAVLTFGVPNKLYCDNGKVFSSGYIHMVCAKLGIALIHSKPYDSPSRGKIERFFRTVRDMFIPTIPYDRNLTLEVLNEYFRQWIHNGYHQNMHRGIHQRPIDRYLNDMPNIRRKEITPEQADYYFCHTIYRTVKNDCTVTVDNELYEVPSKYMGKKVEIRFPLDNPRDLRLYEQDTQVAALKKLDKHFNCENTLSYANQEDEDV